MMFVTLSASVDFEAYADDEIGTARFVITGTKAGVLQAIADGTITNQLEQGGLHETLEEKYPSNLGGSPKDVFVNIYIKYFIVMESYAAKIMITREEGQTWEEAIQGGNSVQEINVTDEDLASVDDMGSGSPGEIPSALELFEAAFPALNFPFGAVIVINGDGGNGNWCGPGTEWICIY